MILITGHRGFIGQNLVKRFKPHEWVGIEITECFDRMESHVPWSRIKKVYHLGAITNTTETNLEIIDRYNIDFTLQLFKKCMIYSIPVAYASSASVYGNAVDKTNPLNQYAASKMILDMYVQDNINRFKNVRGFRFFNVYGDGEENKGSQASPVHTFTKQAKETGVVKVFEGSDKFFRDFIWVEDALNCFMTEGPSGIYDVGTSKPTSFERVAQLIASKYDASIKHIPFPEHLKGKYQTYTCAQNDFPEHKFVSVGDYLNLLN